MAHIRAGNLDRQLYIRKMITQQDAGGASYRTWVDNGWVWADKRVIRTDSKNLDNQNQPIADVEFTCYWDERFDVYSQYVCEGITYQLVQPAIEYGRREFVKLVCRTHIFNKAV